MHVGSNPDDHTTFDADALPQVITDLRARGYSFVTLDALLSCPMPSKPLQTPASVDPGGQVVVGNEPGGGANGRRVLPLAGTIDPGCGRVVAS